MPNIKKIRKLFTIVCSLVLVLGSLRTYVCATDAHNFPDVPSTHVYAKEIQYLKENNISVGFNSGTEFRPESTITRKEMITLLVKGKFPEHLIDSCISSYDYQGKNIFHDVPSTDEFAPFVCMAKVYDITVGYSDGNFRPDEPITADAGIKFIMRTRADNAPVGTRAPLREYTQYLWAKGFYPPTMDRAKESVLRMTRGEFAYVFKNVEFLPETFPFKVEGFPMQFDWREWTVIWGGRGQFNYDALSLVDREYPGDYVDLGNALIFNPEKYLLRGYEGDPTIKFDFKYYCSFQNQPIPKSFRDNLSVGQAVIDLPVTVDLSKTKVVVDLKVDGSDYAEGEFYSLPGRQMYPVFVQGSNEVRKLDFDKVEFYGASRPFSPRALLCVKEGENYIVKFVGAGRLDSTDSVNKRYNYVDTILEILRSH